LIVPNLFRDSRFHHVIIAWDRFNLRFYIDRVESEFRLELTPGVIFFIGSASAAGRRIDVTAFDTAVYQFTYRFLIFVPSGMGWAAIAVKLRPVNRWEGLAIAAAAVGSTILLEIIFAAWNGQNGSVKNMVVNLAVLGLTLGLARSQIAAALREP
jgi:peptidoglycan/LPS O-acetylase OafA/YrhL